MMRDRVSLLLSPHAEEQIPSPDTYLGTIPAYCLDTIYLFSLLFIIISIITSHASYV